MATYTVHEPQPPADNIDQRATGLVFIKEGFAWFAFLIPVLWLLFNRLWRDLFLFLLITVAVVGAVRFAGGNAAAITWAALLINLAFGFEARNIYRAALERRGYALIGVVTARNLAEAERRFLSEWLPGVQPSTGRSAAASTAGEAGSMPIMGAGMAHG